jgi:hypothetical protein
MVKGKARFTTAGHVVLRIFGSIPPSQDKSSSYKTPKGLAGLTEFLWALLS